MNRPTLHDVVPQSPSHQPDWLGGAKRKRDTRRALTAAVSAAVALLAAPMAFQLLRDAGPTMPIAASPEPTRFYTPSPTPTDESSTPGVWPTQEQTHSGVCAEEAIPMAGLPSISSGTVCGLDELEGVAVALEVPTSLVQQIEDSLDSSRELDHTPFLLTAPRLHMATPQGPLILAPATVQHGAVGYAWRSGSGWRFWAPTIPIKEELTELTDGLTHTAGSPDLDICAAEGSAQQLADVDGGSAVVWCDWSTGNLTATRLPADLARDVITGVEDAAVDELTPELTGSYLAAIDAEGLVNPYSITTDGRLSANWPDGTSQVWTPSEDVVNALEEFGLHLS